jgi:hypothetical protein
MLKSKLNQLVSFAKLQRENHFEFYHRFIISPRMAGYGRVAR